MYYCNNKNRDGCRVDFFHPSNRTDRKNTYHKKPVWRNCFIVPCCCTVAMAAVKKKKICMNYYRIRSRNKNDIINRTEFEYREKPNFTRRKDISIRSQLQLMEKKIYITIIRAKKFYNVVRIYRPVQPRAVESRGNQSFVFLYCVGTFFSSIINGQKKKKNTFKTTLLFFFFAYLDRRRACGVK